MWVTVEGDGTHTVIEGPWGIPLWTMAQYPVCTSKPYISHLFIQTERGKHRGFENVIVVSCQSARCAVETAWCYETLMRKISCRRCIFNGGHTDAGISTGALPLTLSSASCTAPKQLRTSRPNFVGVWSCFRFVSHWWRSSICLLKLPSASTARRTHHRIHKRPITGQTNCCLVYIFLFFILT